MSKGKARTNGWGNLQLFEGFRLLTGRNNGSADAQEIRKVFGVDCIDLADATYSFHQLLTGNETVLGLSYGPDGNV